VGTLKRAVHSVSAEEVERVALGLEALLSKPPPEGAPELALRSRPQRPAHEARGKHRKAAVD
jgi:hypothetical protein